MLKPIKLIIFTLFFSGFLVLIAQPLGTESNQIFIPQPVSEKELASIPVIRLKSNLDSHNWHMVKETFGNELALEKFSSKFNMMNDEGKIHAGCFKRNFLTEEITSTVPLSNLQFADHNVRMEVRLEDDPNNLIVVNFQTAYDNVTKHYRIVDLNFVGDLTNIDCIGPPAIMLIPPEEFESSCATDAQSGFVFIKLQNRKTSTDPVNNAIILGETRSNTNIFLEELNNSALFRQIPFPDFTYAATVEQNAIINVNIPNPLYVACRLLASHNFCANTLGLTPSFSIAQIIKVLADNAITYNPGYVISSLDNENNNIDNFFVEITDADGMLHVPDQNGNFVEYPTGFFIDGRLQQITVLSNKNDFLTYGRHTNNYRFTDPVAITVTGKYVYVLDKGTHNSIAVFSVGLNPSGQLTFSFEGTTTFEQNLIYAKDITSFENTDENILYITNPVDQSITRVILDKNTGFQKNGYPSPLVIRQAVDYQGKSVSFGKVEMIESSPRISSTGCNILLVTLGTRDIISFTADALSEFSSLHTNFRYTLPSGVRFRNIGYNLGNNTFYVSDDYQHKIHAFSHNGEYIGSGGIFGKGEIDNELYYPNVISSNIFTTSTKEMIVINLWGEHTGFKKMKPVADIGGIEVIEKAPVTVDLIRQNSLDFRFSLTDGDGVDQIKLDLNGKNIKTLNPTNTVFSAGNFSNNFLVSVSTFSGLQGKVKIGWNTYTVTLDAHISDGLGSMNYQKVKSIEFYYIPSAFTNNFHASNTKTTGFYHNKTDDPLIIYKNVWVPGGDTPAGIEFSMRDGKTIFLRGAVLTINKPTIFTALNEDFEFDCGSNLRLIMKENVGKLLIDCRFDGTHRSDLMVTCLGDFTGTVNSAQSTNTSKLQFVRCNFANYGIAMNLLEGRGRLINCNFQSGTTHSNSSTGILASPRTRLEVLGGNYKQNAIAIDANNATLFVGGKFAHYHSTPIPPTLFTNNNIALHTIATTSVIVDAMFVNNDAAIMLLSGSLDCATNLFQNNTQGIIYSEQLFLNNGYNRFIDNYTDITYIMPLPPNQSTAVKFNVKCNLWQHGAITSNPLFDVKSNPVYDPRSSLVTFDYIPYLEYKNGKTLTCTGVEEVNLSVSKKDGNRNSSAIQDTLLYNESSYFTMYNNINELIMKNDFEKSYQELEQLLKKSNHLQLGEYNYPVRFDTVKAYHECMLKNAIVGYTTSLKPGNSENADVEKYTQHSSKMLNQLIPHFIIGPEKILIHDYIKKDHLEFLKFFLKGGRNYKNYTEQELFNNIQNEIKFEPSFVEIFPNPVSDAATVKITVHKKSEYTLELYNTMGQKVKTIFKQKELESGKHEFIFTVAELNEGLYFVHIGNQKNSQIVLKILIIK